MLDFDKADKGNLLRKWANRKDLMCGNITYRSSY